jgi:hypothetical protein
MDRFYGAELPLIIESTIKNNMKTISDEVERLSRLMLLTARHDWQRIKKSHPKNVDSVCQIVSQEIVRMSLRMSREFKKAHDRITMRLNELVAKPNLDSSDSSESEEAGGPALQRTGITNEEDRIRAMRSLLGGERELLCKFGLFADQKSTISVRPLQQSQTQQSLSKGDNLVSLSSLSSRAGDINRLAADIQISNLGVSSPTKQMGGAVPQKSMSDDELDDFMYPEPYDMDEKEEQTEDCIGSIYYSEVIKSEHLHYRYFRFSDISSPVSLSSHGHMQGQQARPVIGDEQLIDHHLQSQRAREV